MAYVKMVTDSAADIPRALREELDIQVLPFPIAMGDKEYEDGYDFTPEEFYGMLLSAPQTPPMPSSIPMSLSSALSRLTITAIPTSSIPPSTPRARPPIRTPSRPGRSFMRSIPRPGRISRSPSSTPATTP